jgi:hypothetical protein
LRSTTLSEINSLSAIGFRSFREFRAETLNRVNLFVGTNNAGKTSLLEAIELVATGTPAALRKGPQRRGEEVAVDREERGIPGIEIDVSHLFFGHQPATGGSFSLLGEGDYRRFVHCEVLEIGLDSESENIQQHLPEVDSAVVGLALNFRSHSLQDGRLVRLSPYGGLPELRRLIPYPQSEAVPTVSFLGTEEVGGFRLGQLWDALVLTPEEEGVADALRIIEPRIERIAFLGEGRRATRSVFIKLSGSEQRIPLGSVGDGLKRLLNLTIYLMSAKGGFLLVDEIDTGLHYSVMADMWKLVIETAKRLDVQVFATTHSLDCVHALAWVQEKNPQLAEAVTLHRIEKESPSTVIYSMNEIAIAARSHIEVR